MTCLAHTLVNVWTYRHHIWPYTPICLLIPARKVGLELGLHQCINCCSPSFGIHHCATL